MAPTPATLIFHTSSLLTPSQTVFPPKLALLCTRLKSSLYHKALKLSLKKTEKGQEFLHQVKEQRTMLWASVSGCECANGKGQDDGDLVSRDVQGGYMTLPMGSLVDV